MRLEPRQRQPVEQSRLMESMPRAVQVAAESPEDGQSQDTDDNESRH